MTKGAVILHPLSEKDVAFLWQCLGTLRGNVKYSQEDLQIFCERSGLFKADSPVLIASCKGQKFGMLTCNRFIIPRYLGFGVELEEVIIAPEFQGRGLAEEMLAAFFIWVDKQPDIRRVQVRTDDRKRAGRIYSRLLNKTDSDVYAKTINPI